MWQLFLYFFAELFLTVCKMILRALFSLQRDDSELGNVGGGGLVRIVNSNDLKMCALLEKVAMYIFPAEGKHTM